MSVGGDIVEVSYNHPDAGSGFFYPKAGEDSTFDLGGFTRNDDAQSIDGRGRIIDQMTRKRWSVSLKIANDMNDTRELEALSMLTRSPKEGDFTFTHINGTVYAGRGTVVGDVQANGNDATIDVKFSGGGELKQI